MTGKQIRDRAKKQGISAYRIHKDTGISLPTLYDFFKDKRSPRLCTVNKIVEYLDNKK